MTATMAGMTVVNDAKESESFDAFKEKMNEQFGTADKKLRFIAENFLLLFRQHFHLLYRTSSYQLVYDNL